MFEGLSKRLGTVFDRLRGRGALSESDVDAALREVRTALLEADVALPVVRQFIDQVRPKAIGADVIRSVTPGQMVVKIVNDHLVEMLGGTVSDLDLNAVPPVVILMVGLQGSGKTTSSAKIAYRLSQGPQGMAAEMFEGTFSTKRRVLMASLDTRRPAAQQQLAILGEQTGVPTLPIVPLEMPLAITRRAMEMARREGFDVLILDTAGRLSINEELMQEVADISALAQPKETLLVADAMTGQDAVNVAKAFNERLAVTGIVLTRVDGDARGGAALSMRAVTGRPVKLIGVGEKFDALEPFHPDRIASRILGMGDIVSLVERAAETIDKEDAEKLAAKVRKGQFDTAAQDGRPAGSDGHAAGRHAGQGGDVQGQDRRDPAQAPGGDHPVDDAPRAAQPRPDTRLAQEAYRQGLGPAGPGRQQAAQAARRHAQDDEAGEQARRQGIHAQPRGDEPAPGLPALKVNDKPIETYETTREDLKEC